MRTITVKQDNSYAVYLDPDGEFRCLHKDVDIESPCCLGNDCACSGRFSVYCNDCKNEDLRDYEIEGILGF